MTHQFHRSNQTVSEVTFVRRSEILDGIQSRVPLCSTTDCNAFRLGICKIVEEPVDGSKECIPEKRSRSVEY